MTEKELKRLSRAELLELLLMQTRESELLEKKLEETRQELEARELKVQQAGSLADAVLVINGVMESTQSAAQQYLDNITQMEQNTQERSLRMLDDLEQVLLENQRLVRRIRQEPEFILRLLQPEPVQEADAEQSPAYVRPLKENLGVRGKRRLQKNVSPKKLKALMKQYGLVIKFRGDG